MTHYVSIDFLEKEPKSKTMELSMDWQALLTQSPSYVYWSKLSSCATDAQTVPIDFSLFVHSLIYLQFIGIERDVLGR